MFKRDLTYQAKEYWRRKDEDISHGFGLSGTYHNKDDIYPFTNNENFYSITPSIIMGRNVEIHSTNEITQDILRDHTDADPRNQMSRIEANDLLKMIVNQLKNRVLIISTNGRVEIEASQFVLNEGGKITSLNGGSMKSPQKVTNKDLVNLFSIEIRKRDDSPNYNRRVTFNICQEPGIIGTESQNDSKANWVIQASTVENIGSYLLNNSGTLQIIADNLISSSHEIQVGVGQGSDQIQNAVSGTTSLLVGISGVNVVMQIKNKAELIGTNVQAQNELELAEALNYYYLLVLSSIISSYTSFEVEKLNSPVSEFINAPFIVVVP
ncbi:MAG: hypothetical protein EZS28_034705, partial [Streblomastix strix]